MVPKVSGSILPIREQSLHVVAVAKCFDSLYETKVMVNFIVKRKSSPSQEKVKEKVKEKKDLTLLTVWSSLHHPPTHPTINFSNTSRGPTTKFYTFLETSHDP